ncbi:hypothetical protein Q5P01_017316 [Channa striata]|uniref:Putative zinc-ribbon domain-containing protein n=1 Tax=Channa striata TaxID=64152 RepID=A0AA88MCV9_CHASR|nr:hypothetical protein Q5P01_017316 [Channa striata]
MQCSKCGHKILEKTAKFCSECGQKLNVQSSNIQDVESQPKPLVADAGDTAEKTVSEKNGPPVDSKDNKSPKRPNDETVLNPKKKKKKKRKNKKKKDGSMSVDQHLSTSELSHVAAGDNQEKGHMIK